MNVVLGIDPGEHRLGIGVVGLADGVHRACWSVNISQEFRPMMPYRFQRIRAALTDCFRGIGRPAILAIEDPSVASFKIGRALTKQWGAIMADVTREVATIWPTLDPVNVWEISPTGWKKPTGTTDIHHTKIKDRKLRRAENLRHIAESADRNGFRVPYNTDDGIDYDAAAAGLIAMWAWQTNKRGRK